MFNIGGDDKEKLEENMEEIKKLVNQDNEEGQKKQAEETEAESKNKGDEAFRDTTEETGFPNPNQAQQELSGNMNTEDHTEDELNNPSPSRSEKPANQQSTKPDSQVESEDLDRLHDEIKNQISEIEQGNDRSRKDDISNQTQEQEISTDENEEEPLFLDVERFEDIRQMVEEMHYLTTEMDDVMEHLAAGVEEDQETVGEAGQIVDEFQARRDRIEQMLREN